ncbi:hypothetical protein JMM60_06810 [Rhodovulum sulfidophilum]|uniref:Transposase IS4-like domain-containing protein n=1 Tax=Rhodovulum sulfidophilum TaxID=35806 RepID=A0ABS1RR49_RHOSU|nr:hypothetical protein [Rhodovulum sulfidophilum]
MAGGGRRLWRKVHIGVYEQTLESRAIKVTGSNVGDAPTLPELLNRVRADVEIGRDTADGGDDTHKCHQAIADRGTRAFGHSFEPEALLPSRPPRGTAKPWKPATAGAIALTEALSVSE